MREVNKEESKASLNSVLTEYDFVTLRVNDKPLPGRQMLNDFLAACESAPQLSLTDLSAQQ